MGGLGGSDGLSRTYEWKQGMREVWERKRAECRNVQRFSTDFGGIQGAFNGLRSSISLAQAEGTHGTETTPRMEGGDGVRLPVKDRGQNNEKSDQYGYGHENPDDCRRHAGSSNVPGRANLDRPRNLFRHEACLAGRTLHFGFENGSFSLNELPASRAGKFDQVHFQPFSLLRKGILPGLIHFLPIQRGMEGSFPARI